MTKSSKLFLNYLHSNHHFTQKESLLRFQFEFFNIMLLLAIFIPPFISYFHYDVNEILVYSDNAFSILSIFIVFLLRQDKKYYTLAGTIFLPSLFLTISAAFYLSGDDASKIAWGPILFASAFLLQGIRVGTLWFLITMFSYWLAYILYGQEGIYYTALELIFVSFAYFTLVVIVAAFKHKNNADNQSLLEMNETLTQQAKELKHFNEELKKRIESALEESQNKTQSIQRHLDLINEHVITINIGMYGLITNVSSAYCTITKFPKQHFISSPFTSIFGSFLPVEELKLIWKKLQNEETYKAEIHNQDAYQQSYWLEFTISPEYTNTQEHIGYIMIARDISSQKLVQQQQDQLLSQSRHAAMGEMISMIAHQWRQPLATITAITSHITLDIELKQDNALSTQGKLQDIDNQVLHLSSTVEDFRNFFKPTKGIENTYVSELVKEALKLLEHKLKQKINIIYTEKIDICLALYRNELVQVLINILNNAYDALESAHLENPCIIIKEYIENEYIIISVQDNAGGIQEKNLKHIFDPYFSTKTKNGTGLGLYMSKTIVEDHQQGRLVASNKDDGALFKLCIPLSTCALYDS